LSKGIPFLIKYLYNKLVYMKKWWVLFLLLFLADRVVKLAVFSSGSFVANKKAVFGIVSLPLGFILVILAVVAFWFVKEKSLGLFLIFIGGLANVVDRLIYGFVIDYIYIFPIPVFNLADLYINLGIILLLIKFVKVIWIRK